MVVDMRESSAEVSGRVQTEPGHGGREKNERRERAREGTWSQEQRTKGAHGQVV